MRFRCTFFILLSTIFFSFSQNSSNYDAVKIMFYNVENLFDTVDDSLTNDEEFTPYGDRHWTNKKLDQKIENIAKVIIAAGEWNSPVVVGLSEIENHFVLEKLINHPLLRKRNYRIIHKDSPDHRGIDVAMLYRNDAFVPESYSAIPLIEADGDTIASREILHVEGSLINGVKYHFFVNHWPSRYGGLMETDSNRKLAARTLRNAIDGVLSNDGNARIICMGDFNDHPEDESIRIILGARNPLDTIKSSGLVNLSFLFGSETKGTLKHLQEWAIFDQFITSKNVLPLAKVSIYSADFLLEQDTKFPGVKPFRTFAGFRYTGGFSDHLPILLKLQE